MMKLTLVFLLALLPSSTAFAGRKSKHVTQKSITAYACQHGQDWCWVIYESPACYW